MKILILGASGMLGSSMMRVLSENNNWDVFGTIRLEGIKKYFPLNIVDKLILGCDVLKHDDLVNLFDHIQPNIVINCISLEKRLLIESDPLLMIPIYALLPHQLVNLCDNIGARFFHISTDGVFSGAKGNYSEDDPSDAKDLYGITKYIGEIHSEHAITIRTSLIGHELNNSNGLLCWFLSQGKNCKCFSHAIFSGLPSVVLAQIFRDIIIPRPDLHGVYHISSDPISKCDLLRLIAEIYNKSIDIIPDKTTKIDRSLNAERFRLATGYLPPSWPQLIKIMHAYQ